MPRPLSTASVGCNIFFPVVAVTGWLRSPLERILRIYLRFACLEMKKFQESFGPLGLHREMEQGECGEKSTVNAAVN